MPHPRIGQALISVYDKTGLLDFARGLHELGIGLLSTGGTARQLGESGLPVTEVGDYTGFPEMMAGRLKTLHPRVHGGILGRRGTDDEAMAVQDIPRIDLVVVNLYPFQATIARPECTREEAIENIDIGGPTLLRAAAKNHRDVVVVVSPADYGEILDRLQRGAAFSEADRLALAFKAFAHTADYDAAVANYLEGRGSGSEGFPARYTIQAGRRSELRYGENPHQAAALYAVDGDPGPCLADAEVIQGKALSYNNLADAASALECVAEWTEPACVIVKHGNPCGVALGQSLLAAYERAYATDPTSAFGGILAFNQALDRETAAAIAGGPFAEVVLAPAVDAGARAELVAKPNLRLLAFGPLEMHGDGGYDQWLRIRGGLLVQDADVAVDDPASFRVVTQRAPTPEEWQDLGFAWAVVKHVRSNAIVYARGGQTLGVGAGQMSRVDSARIAHLKAADQGHALAGAVVASDAFFPFRDGVDTAAAAGARAVIQPGGARRDAEVIAAADAQGLAMVLTGRRHFRH